MLKLNGGMNITIFYLQIATLALCILAGCYSHAGDIIVAIGDQEVTVDMLTELDRLVQLLESPIFTFVRMEVSERLLDCARPDCQRPIISAS